jgi:thioester reductase-like protein
MSIFMTGATGYLGGYVLHELLERQAGRVSILVRAEDDAGAQAKLWRTLQLHLDGDAFWDAVQRVDFVRGDLHQPGLGIDAATRARLLDETDSVLHVAASLNRKSEKACLNTNLRGTLSVIRLARAIADHKGLRRFSHVSTTAVAGHRHAETVHEDSSIDWDRSDYDPYARTKKFCEHMAMELLEDVEKTFFRPSIVMGDSKKAHTSQFDMVGAFCGLARMPLIPIRGAARFDIVPADFVGEAIARLHLKDKTQHMRYHLSAGEASPTGHQIDEALRSIGKRLRFAPVLKSPFHLAVRGMNRLPRGSRLQPVGAVMKVFWPYITFDTVFDNSRVTSELDLPAPSFTDYGAALFEYATRNRFAYPYLPLPDRREAA